MRIQRSDCDFFDELYMIRMENCDRNNRALC